MKFQSLKQNGLRFDPPADLPKLLESAQAALAEQLQEEIAESQE